MKVTTIKIMQRKNRGNYEHEEITLEAVISEGEDAAGAIIGLRDLVHCSLNGDDVKLSKMAEEVLSNTPTDKGLKTVQLSKEGEPNATAQMSQDSKYPDAKEEPAKPAAGTKSKAAPRTTKPVDKSDVAGVEPKEPQAATSVAAPKGSIVFDNTDKNLRIRLSNYLNTNYPKWKTIGDEEPNTDAKKARILETIAPLNGQPFEDSQANMLPTFAKQVETIFKAYK